MVADWRMEGECRQGGVELRKIRVVDIAPCEGIEQANRKGVDPVEGSEILEMRFQGARGKPHVSDGDVQMSGVFEEIAFAHERHEAEFEFATVPLYVSLLLFRGEYLLVVLP